MTGRRIAEGHRDEASSETAISGPRWLRPVDAGSMRRPSTRYATQVKPALDRVGGSLMLVVLAPVIAAIAVTVRLRLGPGVLYRQERIGLDGRSFAMLKFRTMHADRRRVSAGATRPDRRYAVDRRSGRDRRRQQAAFDGPDRRRGTDQRSGLDRRNSDRRLSHKTANDPRHTRVGRFLRHYSLDELPQLVNVVRGELSLVGPRPELPEVVARYEPWQHERHRVKPGVTGLWQVTERADDVLMIDHVDTDLHYIARQSPWLDLRILVRTPLAMLGVQTTTERLWARRVTRTSALGELDYRADARGGRGGTSDARRPG